MSSTLRLVSATISATGRAAAAAACRSTPRNQAMAMSTLDQSWSPNDGSTFPAFNPIDNTDRSKDIDMSKHHADEWSRADVAEAMRANSVFSWGASDPLRESTIHMKRGEGVYLYDYDGKEYMDWSAGAVCTNLGHDVPQSIQDAVAQQMKDCAFMYGDLTSHDQRARLSALLAELAPADLNGFLYASGGSEANEAAIRMARRMTGRPKIMSRYRSYHGGSSSSLAMTGDPRTWAVDAGMPGFVKMMDPFPFNWQWDADPEKASRKCLDALHDQILYEGPESIAAIFLEAITGANGWLKPPDSYMQGVRALCDKYGILLVSDEVMNGFGRTGTMFGFQQFEGVIPDMFTFAKGVTSAYLPLSGVGMRDHVFDYFRTNPVGYGSTYFAHPVCCAAGYATLKHIVDTNLVDHVRAMEPVMAEGLAELVDAHPSVKQARVTGLGAGFDLGDGKGNFMMNMHEAHPGVPLLKKALADEGLITLMRGHHVHCTPPLIVNEQEIKKGIEKLHRGLDKLDAFLA
jgi:taurine---2-oxoglutarate transaminase